jgi:ubiquinone/menaquinone biosynthesis C-methylase UbiE
MTLERLRRHWDLLGKKDPLWAVLALENKRGNRWRVDEFFATGQDEIEEVTKYVEALGVKLDRRNALDFGCGVGRLTQALADRFEVVWGVDFAPSMIEQAKHFDRHPGTCHYILNERADLRMFESASFGFIYSNIVLQHIEPRYQRSYLKEFVRVLTPGGVLVFQLPSDRVERESGTRGSLKQAIKSVAPAPILSAYERIRWGRRALIKMWGMPRDEVTGLLLAEGATILDVRADGFAGANWAGFRYTVTK